MCTAIVIADAGDGDGRPLTCQLHACSGADAQCAASNDRDLSLHSGYRPVLLPTGARHALSRARRVDCRPVGQVSCLRLLLLTAVDRPSLASADQTVSIQAGRFVHFFSVFDRRGGEVPGAQCSAVPRCRAAFLAPRLLPRSSGWDSSAMPNGAHACRGSGTSPVSGRRSAACHPNMHCQKRS